MSKFFLKKSVYKIVLSKTVYIVEAKDYQLLNYTKTCIMTN